MALIESATFVAITHPDIEGVTTVALSSFKGAHRHKGWKRVDASSTVEQLTAAADALGVDIERLGPNPSKAALSAAINPDEDAPKSSTPKEG